MSKKMRTRSPNWQEERNKFKRQLLNFSNKSRMVVTRTCASTNFAERIRSVSLISSSNFLFKDESELSKFTDDKSILFHCTKVLLKTKDPEGLICSDSISINDGNLEKMTDEQIISCFDDIYQLGTSFIDTNKEKKQPIIHCAI